MGKYLLGIDCGTSVVKCCIVDLEGNELGTASRKIPIDVPNPNWVEVDMMAVWSGVKEIIPECMSKLKIKADEIAGIGVTGQGDGNWFVDEDGEPLDRAVLWTDGRAIDIIKRWIDDGVDKAAFPITGSGCYPGSFQAIMRWNMENRPELVKRAYKNLWAKDWVQLRLTGTFTTDETDPSISVLDARKRQYSEEVIKLYGLEEVRHLLPEIVQSEDMLGAVTARAAQETGLNEGTPVVKGMLDVVATATGVGCITEGDACTILGTTCANEAICSAPSFEPKDVGMTICHGLRGLWLKGMLVSYGTPNLDWFLKNFGLPYHQEAEKRGVNVFEILDEVLERTAPGCQGIIYSPYLGPGGERAPFLKPEARAQFFGLTEEHTLDQMLRSVYEGIGLSMVDAYDNIPSTINRITLSGGGAKSGVWCQMLSDINGTPLQVPAGTEFGAKGVAMFAGVAVGLFNDIQDAVKKCVKVEREYKPNTENTRKYAEMFKVYRNLRDELLDSWDMLARARKVL